MTEKQHACSSCWPLSMPDCRNVSWLEHGDLAGTTRSTSTHAHIMPGAAGYRRRSSRFSITCISAISKGRRREVAFLAADFEHRGDAGVAAICWTEESGRFEPGAAIGSIGYVAWRCVSSRVIACRSEHRPVATETCRWSRVPASLAVLIHTVFDLLAAASALAMTAWSIAGGWAMRGRRSRRRDWLCAGPGDGCRHRRLRGGHAQSLAFGRAGRRPQHRGRAGGRHRGHRTLQGGARHTEDRRGSSSFRPSPPASMVGRWGCFLSGLEDQTHGTPTALPWGHDFGDGMLRHPVQLYESFAMGLFLVVALVLIGKRNPSSCGTAST